MHVSARTINAGSVRRTLLRTGDVMKFRMIFLGTEQDLEGRTVPELDADIPVDESSPRCYEYSGTHIVRRDQLANGRVRRTPI